jgi:hypothetical protein
MSGPGIVGGDDRDLPSLGFECSEVADVRHAASHTPGRLSVLGKERGGTAGISPAGTCRMDQVLLRDEQLHEPVTVHDESVPCLSYRSAFRPANGPVPICVAVQLLRDPS